MTAPKLDRPLLASDVRIWVEDGHVMYEYPGKPATRFIYADLHRRCTNTNPLRPLRQTFVGCNGWKGRWQAGELEKAALEIERYTLEEAHLIARLMAL